MTRRVRLDPEYAAPVLRGLAPEPKRRLKAALRELDEEPGVGGRLDVKELDITGRAPRVYRLRVGVWRVAYVHDARGVLVVRIFHRREGYGWLERFG